MTIRVEYKHPHPRLAGDDLRGRDRAPYIADADLLAAANAALVLQMPLLLTGKAGCGKTDFAYAAASGLAEGMAADGQDAKPLECYVRSDTRARDLLYHYDAIRRFGDAQHGGTEGKRRAEDPRHYIELRPLGRALMAKRPCVVLIDEIDKAPRDLPNDLLRELDQGHFEIPEITRRPAKVDQRADGLPIDADDPMTFCQTMVRPKADQKPFVIITSNVERQLPDPFLRRCVFFHIRFPDDDLLSRILRSRFEHAPELLLDRALDVFTALRKVASLTKTPATSELINWVSALWELYTPESALRALDVFTDEARSPRWSELPALGCLIKLREDLGRLEELPAQR